MTSSTLSTRAIEKRLPTEWFALAAGFCLIAFITIRVWEVVDTPLALQNAATSFAAQLRDVQKQARDHNSFVTVQILTAGPGKPTKCMVSESEDGSFHTLLLPSVYATGEVRLDPQGVPTEPASFVFKKGDLRMKVAIDDRGDVHVSKAVR